MQPSLSTYQQAADSIYNPQQATEAATLSSNNANNIKTLDAGKAQIGTDYASAVQNLNNTTANNVGTINSLYTSRLGGNFSGLQGNDLGQMFAKSQQVQGNIESTRANKLAAISTQEANDTNTTNTNIAGLASKYSGLKSAYANSNYDAAVKSQQDNYYKQANLQLAQQRNNIAASNVSNSANSQRNIASSLDASFQGLKGTDGYIRPSDYITAKNSWVASGLSSSSFDRQFSNYRNPYTEDVTNGKTRSTADYKVG
jgi:hypothetical protein